VDSLGFLSQEAMVHEILSWRSMVVPVLHTTGINTKVYTALALGVPLIITPAAAAPFEFPRNSTVAFVAADAQGFEAAVDQVVSSDETWRQLSRASREHWASLLRDDRADSDVRELVSELRACLSRDGFMRKAKLSPVTFSWAVGDMISTPVHHCPLIAALSSLPCLAEGSTASVDLAGVVTQKRNTSLLNCFARERNVTQPSGERGSEDRENYSRAATARGTPFLPLMIGVHASSGGNSSFSYTKRLVSAVWRTVCGACDLECYLPNSAASHLSVPRGTQLVVANLARHHVLDVDGVGLEQRIQAQTNRSVLPSNQSLLPRVLQWMHFVVEVGEQLQELPQPELASALRSASSQSASDESLGASATRMMLPTDPKSTLMPPRITSVCQVPIVIHRCPYRRDMPALSQSLLISHRNTAFGGLLFGLLDSATMLCTTCFLDSPRSCLRSSDVIETLQPLSPTLRNHDLSTDAKPWTLACLCRNAATQVGLDLYDQ